MIRGRRIDVREGGARLDALVLAECPTSTRGAVRAAIADGRVLLCGRRALKGARVRAGDVVDVVELEEPADIRVAPNASLSPRIVYDDGVLIGADKPAGMPVQPLSPRETGTLMNALVAYAPEVATVGDDPLMAGALHRIDTWTSGLVLASRSEPLWRNMRDLFAARKVRKTYLALVEGRMAKGGIVSCRLAHDPSRAHCRMVRSEAADAMFAETSYRPIRTIGGRTLVEAVITTGVTHQIRAQLAIAGFPIVGDPVYGRRDPIHSGQALHALSVSFPHPVTSLQVDISTPPPTWAGDAIPPHVGDSR